MWQESQTGWIPARLTNAQHGNKAALLSLMHNKAAGYVHISFGELEADTNLQQDPWQKREEN